MDPKHSGDVVKHLEKQNELLMEAYRSMSHELRSLQVEEEMLMRKYHEFMTAHDLAEKIAAEFESLCEKISCALSSKKTSDGVDKDEENGALVVVASREEQ